MNSSSAADDPSAHHTEIHLHYKATASLTVYENSSKLVMYSHCISGQSPTQTVIRSNVGRATVRAFQTENYRLWLTAGPVLDILVP